MKQLCILAALAALWGCRAAQQEAGVPISFATTEQTTNQSKALASGDIVGLFATIDGTERYLMENTPFAVDADGRSLSTTPAVYYPDRKEAMNFYAYFPYGSGTSFSVPSDQSTASALQAADLCWAKASSTPIASAVPLQFGHKLARLVVVANQTPSKITAPNAFSGGLLDIRTGLFTNTLKSSVSTTGNELILPAQTIARLVLTISGVEYVFEGAIALEAAKTTTANLTLNVATKTATLSGSSTINWTTATAEGNSSKSVSNALSFYWVPTHWRAAEVDKVVLTIKQGTSSADYTITSGVTHNNSTFQFLFSANGIGYPYTIEKVALYKATELVQTTERHLGGTVYKPGAHTFGVNAQPINPPAPSDYIKIGSLYWAKGNLVAVSKDNNRECKVGAPADHGLTFQFGSLIGFKCGALTNGGTGVGVTPPYTMEYWGGATSYSWANDAMVWPEEMIGTKTTWTNTTGENIATLNDYYFNYSLAPYNGYNINIRNYPGLAVGDLANKGIGDPCSFYLGSNWRLPASNEWNIITGPSRSWLPFGTPGLTARWVSSSQSFFGISGPGAWLGPGMNSTTMPDLSKHLFFPIASNRGVDGSISYSNQNTTYLSTSTYGPVLMLSFVIWELKGVLAGADNWRSFGKVARCVSDAP